MSNTTVERVLGKKKKALYTYVKKYSRAIGAVTGTIKTLETINGKIEEEMNGISEIQEEIDFIKSGLLNAREQNIAVAKKFKELIGIE